MINGLPSVVLTGASGFVGRYFLNQVKNQLYIIAIARRSSMEASVPIHPNIQWIQWDIADESLVDEIAGHIEEQGGADYVIHLAGYYDFDYKDKPEYERTNIRGTANVLELAKKLKVKRFIFASSLAACSFPENGGVITEKTAPDAAFGYARSKKAGEEMMRNYSDHFSCSVVRFAAVFSDWCEYAPLYKFLSTWLSHTWNARVLAGQGESSITYIHIHDLKELLLTIIHKNRYLPSFDIYIASPDGSTTHKELFYTSTRDYFGKAMKPWFVFRGLAYAGILFRTMLGHMGIIPDPFEKLWMIKYIDKQLMVDASYTRKVLGWEPKPRYHILRRLLFLLINMKSHTGEWKVKNEESLLHVEHRPNLLIYQKLLSEKKELMELITEHIVLPDNEEKFSNYRQMKANYLESRINTIYNLLLATIRSGDRSLILKYMDDIALENYSLGIDANELIEVLKLINFLTVSRLLIDEEMKAYKQEIHDYVALALQLAQDEAEDAFEMIRNKFPGLKISKRQASREAKERSKLILKLSMPYQVYSEEEEEKSDVLGDKFSIYDMR